MTQYGLRDDQWERIKDLLSGRRGHVGVTAKDNRRFVEAVLYRYRAGIPWPNLNSKQRGGLSNWLICLIWTDEFSEFGNSVVEHFQ